MTTIKLALFDISGTLTIGNAWRGITQSPAISKFRRRRLIGSYLPLWLLQKAGLYSELRFRDRWIRALAWLLRGKSRETIDEIFDWGVNQYLLDYYRDDVIAELQQYQRDGAKIVIVSNIFQGFVDRLVERLGADGGIGTVLDYNNNVANGKLASEPSAGDQKVRNVEQWLTTHDFTVVLADEGAAYADSISDVPLLLSVKNPTATYPDRKLLAQASERGWRVLS